MHACFCACVCASVCTDWHEAQPAQSEREQSIGQAVATQSPLSSVNLCQTRVRHAKWTCAWPSGFDELMLTSKYARNISIGMCIDMCRAHPQAAPPATAAAAIERVRMRVPLEPQLSVHADHGCQSDSWQSIGHADDAQVMSWVVMGQAVPVPTALCVIARERDCEPSAQLALQDDLPQATPYTNQCTRACHGRACNAPHSPLRDGTVDGADKNVAVFHLQVHSCLRTRAGGQAAGQVSVRACVRACMWCDLGHLWA